MVDSVREATNDKGADVVFDFVGTDETHAASLAMLARRGIYSVVGYGGMVTQPSVAMIATETAIWGNLVGSWIDLWGSSNCMRAARSSCAPRRSRSKR